MRINHPEIQIIGDPTNRLQTRSSLRSQGQTTLISEVDPKHIDDTIQEDNWVKAMQEELDQFEKNDV